LPLSASKNPLPQLTQNYQYYARLSRIYGIVSRRMGMNAEERILKNGSA